MTAIVISSDDKEAGQEIAERTAEALGYTFVGLPLLKQVGSQYNVAEDKLLRALNGSLAARLTGKSRDLLVAYVQAATLEQILADNVVCAGLAAHLYIKDVSHVLMVRVLADADALAKRIARRKKLPARKAEKILEKERARRARWSIETFGVDETAASVYDMVISLSQIEADKAVEVIRDMAGYRKFQPMTYSRKCLQDLVLAAKVRAALLPSFPSARVTADGETAIVHVKCSKRQKQKTAETIKQVAREIPGVGLVEVHAAK
jgi:cytidylate kinase